MKKIISLILVIAIAMLVACTETTEADTQTKYLQDYWQHPEEEHYSIRVDKETGVNYIVFDGFYYCKDLIDHNKHTMDVVDFNADIQGLLDKQPTFDYEKMIGQYVWERDVAISQLEQLGIRFGEKLDDEVIKKVNRIITNSRVKAGGRDEDTK